ncbi:MAG TPA: hypothetical protein VKE70_36570 [Candidatus Solibacter sp.]|nr:hypothetical protein [Candidatus Solibacter sp.]
MTTMGVYRRAAFLIATHLFFCAAAMRFPPAALIVLLVSWSPGWLIEARRLA